MNYLKILVLCVVLTGVLLSCSSDDKTITGGGEYDELIQVRIDLQMGFENKCVDISVNGTQYYKSCLSGLVPFSGPQASFVTYLPRSSDTIVVSWREGGKDPKYEETLEVEFGDLSEYFIGLRMTEENAIVIVIQERHFGYV